MKLLFPVYTASPIMQPFGANPRVYRRFAQLGHNGIDIGVVEGSVVIAMHDGVVRFAGDGFDEPIMGTAAGNCVLLATDAYLTGYAHLSRVYALPGSSVKAGDVIGLSGKTGATTGPHLHIELIPLPLRLDNGYFGRIDPAPHLGTPLCTVKGTPLPPTQTPLPVRRTPLATQVQAEDVA